MREDKLLAILRLQKTKHIGDVLAKKLIATVGDVEHIFQESVSSLSKVNGIGDFALRALTDKTVLQKAENELKYIQNEKLSYSYFLEDDYPKNLKHCIDAPILFFKDGTIDFTNKKILSIVGTRNITRYGKDLCHRLIEELKYFNPIIVSGFAYGVDIEAHRAAIENHLQTIGVLAHGFGQIYPKAHKKYVHQMIQNGGFISEFWFHEDPLREHFLKRNRIVAGLSQATIIIESAEKGGSLVTADIANSYDRDVFAFPGKTTDVYSQGCNRLIQQHKAHLVQSADDIIKMLNWDVESNVKPKQKKISVALTEDERKVYNYLKDKSEQLLDVIAIDTQIPTFQLSSILLQMELKGIVKPLPGKVFSID